MYIQEMFRTDIGRKIDGVIKAGESAPDAIEREVREYVVTKALEKHFRDFFRAYSASFGAPTADVGVWISGYFGSGKSHLLKMLSHLLENRDIRGVRTADLFREKFEGGAGDFLDAGMPSDARAETILFNIDIDGPIEKDDTAVLRAMARVFFNHIGFCGDHLKVAKLEQYVARCGKTEEFRRVFEQKRGRPWTEMRGAYRFNRNAVVAALGDVLGMREADADAWVRDASSESYSIARFADDIKEYVDGRPENFRLLFMIDEAGQYVGDSTGLLLNLQSVVEKLGTVCRGKVWCVCTGQEALDDICRRQNDAFSKIQARFGTRLALSSSSAGEVIRKRLLQKTEAAAAGLAAVYGENESVLRNLFAFADSGSEIRGYSGPHEYAADYPFVPYQFVAVQNVFRGIQKHGNAGRHVSAGERSMISCFQEAALALCRARKDEHALAPLHLFYDAACGFLDGTFRRAIERCRKDVEDGGLEAHDADVLKTLCLIRLAEDIRPSLDHIVVFMADDIRTDKIRLRECVQKSLDRLLGKNYVSRSNGCYRFMTDEERDVQREIAGTPVDASSVVERIWQIIFGEICTTKKYRYKKRDFDFDRRVDQIGNADGAMGLHFLTDATDASEKGDVHLMATSRRKAVVALDEQYSHDGSNAIERSMKVRKYIRLRDASGLPAPIRAMLSDCDEEAGRDEREAAESLAKAIEHARFFVDGKRLPMKGGDAKSRIDRALKYLVAHVYGDLELIGTHYEGDDDIDDILSGRGARDIDGKAPNAAAADKVAEYIEMQSIKNRPVSMDDIQSRYQGIPYGWREIDIAAVVAQLIYDRKAAVRYEGRPVRPDDGKLAVYLRKKTEIGKTTIEKRESVTASAMTSVRSFLREYLDVMDVPEDIDMLITFMAEHFDGQSARCSALLRRYASHPYPGKEIVERAVSLVTRILASRGDAAAFVGAVLDAEDSLLDIKEDMHGVESFFEHQVHVFDAALMLLGQLDDELDYFAGEDGIGGALAQIREITGDARGCFRRIPELNPLMRAVWDGHDRLLDAKREEIAVLVAQCRRAVREAAEKDPASRDICAAADDDYSDIERRAGAMNSLALLDSLKPRLAARKDSYDLQIGARTGPKTGLPKNACRPHARQILFPAATLENEHDVLHYLDNVRETLLARLKDGAIELK